MNFNKVLSVGVLASAALLATSANAAFTPVSSFTTVFQSTELTGLGAPTPAFGSLALFDSTLGTLIGGTLHVTGDIQGTITLTLGNTGAPANVKGTTSSDFGFNSSNSFIDGLDCLR